MKKTLLLLVGFMMGTTIWAGEIILMGKYKGSNVYVQNPYDVNKDAYCTSAVFVNDRKVQDYPEALAYTIDLSHFNIGDLVVLRIVHSDHCRPKVVNLQVLTYEEGFEFILEQVNNNSISWNTKGESPEGKFIVEQLHPKKHTWKAIKEVKGKGMGETNQYSIVPTHYDGENEYRIKYLAQKDVEVYSTKLLFTYTNNPVQFKPKTKVMNTIVLSEEIPYSISDMNRNKVKEGIGKVIMVHDLKPGLYYLHIQNRSERFIKQ